MGVIPERGDPIADNGGLSVAAEGQSVEAQTPEQELLLRLIEQLERGLRDKAVSDGKNKRSEKGEGS